MAASPVKKIVFVYIHGFLGDEKSFNTFPHDLVSYLSHSTSVDHDEIFDVKVYPKYDTKGSNPKAVSQLVDYLLRNAGTTSYSGVILMAHSMGGLAAVDAYRSLYGVDSADGSDAPSFAASGISNETPSQAATVSAGDIRKLINIIGIVTFDSPFYGLTPNVFTESGSRNAMNYVSSMLPFQSPTEVSKAPAGPKPDNGGNEATAAAQDGEPAGIRATPADTATNPLWAATSMVSSVLAPLGNHARRFGPYVFAGGAAAAAAYASFGLASTLYPSPSVQRLAARWLVSAADEAYRHAEFLYPLTDSKEQMHRRVAHIQQEVEGRRCFFKGYYLDISIDPPSPTESPISKHFCNPPDPQIQHLFEKVESLVQDEISAHMNMFHPLENREKYLDLIIKTARTVHQILHSSQK
ncbi:uncharacterized protein BJ171DRAFT_499037 [Polychytrium aggregatum]|uniref:uncharacterized protein n=1 Tax=Polychytrium aggregatum TaxID=110093 RepID=UPI0022FF1E3A|nr:uncharacterized protein BJ171DRAFT_499037 [Polychytrium aggregatum]KAI9206181.1 hypothetical protein BJ171DRAFT_499037 [Polychytrium aggregatum]